MIQSLPRRNYATGTGTPYSKSTWAGGLNQTDNMWALPVSPDWMVDDYLTLSVYYEITGLAWSGGAANIYIQGSGDVTEWTTQLVSGAQGSNPNRIYYNAATSGSGVAVTGRLQFKIKLSAEWLTNTVFNIGFRADYITAGTMNLHHCQVEFGEVATDWSLNPADVDKDLANAKSSLSFLNDEIVAKVTKGDQEIYLRYGIEYNGIRIGKVGDPFEVGITNTKISFYQTGEEIAYISGSKLYITNSEILQNLQFGPAYMVKTSAGYCVR